MRTVLLAALLFVSSYLLVTSIAPGQQGGETAVSGICLLYTSPSPRDS